MSTPSFILGFADQETVKLDLDGMSLRMVRYWARKILDEFDMWGYLIRQSSEGSYHVLFDRPVSWEENLSIVAWVYLATGSKDLNRWLVMQCRKTTSTLRCTPKGDKNAPINIEFYGGNDFQIASFMKYEKAIHRIQNLIFDCFKKRIIN